MSGSQNYCCHLDVEEIVTWTSLVHLWPTLKFLTCKPVKIDRKMKANQGTQGPIYSCTACPFGPRKIRSILLKYCKNKIEADICTFLLCVIIQTSIWKCISRLLIDYQLFFKAHQNFVEIQRPAWNQSDRSCVVPQKKWLNHVERFNLK